MTAIEHYIALVERYKKNNVDLAISLNEKRNELRAANDNLIEKCREVQEKKDEIIYLKQKLAERDAQLNQWRTTMIEVFQTNTRQYARLMGMIGCNTAASSAATIAPATAIPTTNPTSTVTSNVKETKVENQEVKINESNSSIRENFVERRVRRGNNNCEIPFNTNDRLSNLTEESAQNSKEMHDLSSLSDVSHSKSSTPKKSTRLSQSLTDSFTPPHSPPQTKIKKTEPPKKNNKNKKKPLKEKNQNLLVEKENIFNEKENEKCEKEEGNRPRRKAAPLKLQEPKINIKMRRK